MTYQVKIQCAVLLFLCTNWAIAKERLFQVELIVFTQSAPNTELFEQIETELEPVRRYAKVKSGEKSLQNTYNRLQKAGGYLPIFYESWQIEASSGRVSLPIKVETESDELTGWIKIQRGNLLYVLADLEFSPVVSELEDEGLIYRLTEKRRILLDEVHYLDHPFFGAVIKVSPVEVE